jgi:hypothetical protein
MWVVWVCGMHARARSSYLISFSSKKKVTWSDLILSKKKSYLISSQLMRTSPGSLARRRHNRDPLVSRSTLDDPHAPSLAVSDQPKSTEETATRAISGFPNAPASQMHGSQAPKPATSRNRNPSDAAACPLCPLHDAERRGELPATTDDGRPFLPAESSGWGRRGDFAERVIGRHS